MLCIYTIQWYLLIISYLTILFKINVSTATENKHFEIDINGYIAYCPCMGRFGNQADHFLGSLNFAQSINRTLILPAWIEYRKGELKSIQIPFDRYFQIEPLKEYHRVITIENFMKHVAPIIWPPEKRTVFCYSARKSLDVNNTNVSCNAKEGNPFGPFWDNYNIDFINSEYYNPLNYDTHYSGMTEKWIERYPSDKWPVIAFVGAPAVFPVQLENRYLHKYLKWTKELENMGKQFIKQTLPKGAFIGIHLRNGLDWIRACEHIKNSPDLFSAPQCVGYRNENGPATLDMCIPNKDIILKQLKREIKKFNELNPTNLIKSIFVASDNNHMINYLNDGLQRMKIEAFKNNGLSPHLDLVILGWSNYFIGNCISSYTAFVKRERDVRGFQSGFWAYPTPKSDNAKRKVIHEEL